MSPYLIPNLTPGEDLKYGTDIEFVIEFDGAPAPAGLILPFQGMLGTDNHGNSRGMRDTGEIRTRTFTDVTEIVRDVARALNTLYEHVLTTATGRARRIAPVVFLTGHFHHGRSIGGHVHFSSLWFSRPAFTHAVRLLFGWANAFMNRYDDLNQMTSRAQAGYLVSAWENSTRVKEPSMGIELYHWEFRQWGSFLLSPLYCYTVLALSKIIVMNCLMTTSEQTILRLPTGLMFAESPEKIEQILAEFPIRTPDLQMLGYAFRQLEETREEMRERWSADFMELWRDAPSPLAV